MSDLPIWNYRNDLIYAFPESALTKEVIPQPARQYCSSLNNAVIEYHRVSLILIWFSDAALARSLSILLLFHVRPPEPLWNKRNEDVKFFLSTSREGSTRTLRFLTASSCFIPETNDHSFLFSRPFRCDFIMLMVLVLHKRQIIVLLTKTTKSLGWTKKLE